LERAEALGLVRKYTRKDITYRHLVSVGAVMEALADHFGEDEQRWGLAGLFHDLDYDVTENDFDRHPLLAVEWLRAEGYEDEGVLNAILGHRFEDHQTDLMSRAIVHADAVAGLLVAYALVRPDKARGMKASSVRKKLKEKAFAPGVNREEILSVEAKIDLALDEFLAISISGLEKRAAEIGLA
jgi:putative nucleotidyltransferase with HDIG domain